MRISSSANDRKPVAVTRARESSSSIPITLSEWSSINSYFCRVSMVPTAFLENASQLHRPLFVHYTRVTAYNHPRLWLYPSAYISFRLHQFACRNRLHTICAISSRCMDRRTDRGNFPDVWNFHTYRSYSWYSTRFSVIRRAWLHGMVMDLRHVSAPMPVSYSNPGRSASGC